MSGAERAGRGTTKPVAAAARSASGIRVWPPRSPGNARQGCYLFVRQVDQALGLQLTQGSGFFLGVAQADDVQGRTPEGVWTGRVELGVHVRSSILTILGN